MVMGTRVEVEVEVKVEWSDCLYLSLYLYLRIQNCFLMNVSLRQWISSRSG